MLEPACTEICGVTYYYNNTAHTAFPLLLKTRILLLLDYRIRIRKDSNSVYSPTDKEIHRGSYPGTVCYKDLNEALKFLNDDSIFYLYRYVTSLET